MTEMKKKNYRPVSILNCFSEIYETFLNKQLLPFVNRSLSELVFAYRSRYSRRSLSRTLKGPAKKFEITGVRDNGCQWCESSR